MSAHRPGQTSEKKTKLLAQNEECNSRKKQLKAELNQVHLWAMIFDTSENDVKKRIASNTIKRVNVVDGGKFEIELNICIQQFVDGMDSITAETEINADNATAS